MTNPVMTVNGVGKVFRQYRHEIFRILEWFSFRVSNAEEKWVLRDVTFDVAPGQAVAIVGRNGAGKSTLLKLIAGTMRASEGRVAVSGTISAILELGMGFNPDFTGRQNVFHALGLMGRQHREIEGVVEDIKAFSELDDYFDQPLRVYSSGMQMRLAFSVATAFRPDILIIDEALAVGDSYFQHKSFEKIRNFQESGTTLILVSHDRVALLSLCNRAILLHNGSIARDGEPESVLDYYNALLSDADAGNIETESLSDGRTRTISGSRKASIETVALLDSDGDPVDTLNVGDEAVLRVTTKANENLSGLVLGYAIKDRLGQTLYGTNTYYCDQALEAVEAGATHVFEIRFSANLGPGSYSVALALTRDQSHIEESYEWRDLAITFEVVNVGKKPFDGKMYLPSEITVDQSG